MTTTFWTAALLCRFSDVFVATRATAASSRRCVMLSAVKLATYLLIDISNSFTKFAFASATRLSGTHRIATRDLTTAYLRQLLRRRKADSVVVSSVVPDKAGAIKAAAGGS